MGVYKWLKQKENKLKESFIELNFEK